jgi:CHAT domain-containing protein/HEAT repeat protein/tetratricopeptide (TPR) repeat protein
MESRLDSLTNSLLYEYAYISRASAARELGELATPLAVPPLIRALGDEEGSVRHAAAETLEKYGEGILSNAVLAFIENQSPQPLCKLKDARAIAPVFHLVALGRNSNDGNMTNGDFLFLQFGLHRLCRVLAPDIQPLLKALREELSIIEAADRVEKYSYRLKRTYSSDRSKWVELLFVRTLYVWHPPGSREALLAALGSSHNEVVESAGVALAKLDDTQSASLVGRLFRGEEQAFDELSNRHDQALALPFLRRLEDRLSTAPLDNAIKALTIMREARTIEALKSYLKIEDVAERVTGSLAVEIVNAFCVLGGAPIMPYLIELTEHTGKSSSYIRPKRSLGEAAADALSKMGQPAVALITKAIRQTYGKQRDLLANALTVMGTQAVPALIELIHDSRDELQRIALDLAKSLGGQWPAVIETILALRSDDPSKRLEAVNAAGRLSDQAGRAVVPALTPLLSDKSIDVRFRTIAALKKIRDPSSISPLLEALGKSTSSWWPLSFELIRAIWLFERQAETISRDNLTAWSVDHRRGAAYALIHRSLFLSTRLSTATLDKLREVLGHTDERVRGYTAVALGGVRDFESCIPLLARLSDSSEQVRSGAYWALVRILDLPYGPEHQRQFGDLVNYSKTVIDRGTVSEAGEQELSFAFFVSVATECTRKPDTLINLLNLLENQPAATTPSRSEENLRLALCLAMHLAVEYKRQEKIEATIAVERQVVSLARKFGSPQVEWRALHSIGEQYVCSGNDKSAWEYFRQAIEVIDRLWFALLDENQLRHFFRDKAQLYDQMMLCCLRLGHYVHALEYGEKAKTRYLGDLIARRQLPRRKQLDRVAEEFWEAVAQARQELQRGSKSTSELETSGSKVVGVTWGVPPIGSQTAVPVRRAALEDYLAEHPQGPFNTLIENLWVIASKLQNTPEEAEIQAGLEDLYQALRPVLSAFENHLLPLSPSERDNCLAQYRAAAQRLSSYRTTQQLPLWVFSEYGVGWLRELLEQSSSDGNLGVLILGALIEGLSAVLHHEPVYAKPGPSAGAGEQLLLEIADADEPRAVQDLGQRLSNIVEPVMQRHSQSRWRFVEMIARGETATFREVQSLVEGQTNAAIVQFYLTEHGTFAYLIPGQNVRSGGLLALRSKPPDLEVFKTDKVTLERLKKSLFKDRVGWFAAQKHILQTGETSRAFGVLNKMLKTYYQDLFAPLDARLKELKINRLLIIPHRALQVLPLHALCYEEGYGAAGQRMRYLIDDYEIAFAPSGTLARIALQRHKTRRRPRRLVAIENPTGDPNLSSAYEIASASQHFPDRSVRVLRGRRATIKRLTKLDPGTYFHSSGHADYVWSDPLDSALQLAKDERLSVGALFEEQLSLTPTRLACLSACDTGMTDPDDVADEFVGISGGFLFAGAASVISTLWIVSDSATSLLMDRFYSEYFHNKSKYQLPNSAAAALGKAQRWLRDSTVAEIRHHLSNYSQSIDEPLREQLLTQFDDDPPDERPFAHPYYWAGFSVSGPVF